MSLRMKEKVSSTEIDRSSETGRVGKPKSKGSADPELMTMPYEDTEAIVINDISLKCADRDAIEKSCGG